MGGAVVTLGWAIQVLVSAGEGDGDGAGSGCSVELPLPLSVLHSWGRRAG